MAEILEKPKISYFLFMKILPIWFLTSFSFERIDTTKLTSNGLFVDLCWGGLTRRCSYSTAPGQRSRPIRWPVPFSKRSGIPNLQNNALCFKMSQFPSQSDRPLVLAATALNHITLV